MKRNHTRSPSLPTLGLGENIFSRKPPRQYSEAADELQSGTIVGRAVNIANTAKDLFGALWSYGSQQDQTQSQSLEPSTEDETGSTKVAPS